MRYLAIIFASLLPAPVLAQTPSSPPNPEMQAVVQKLMSEINQGLQCNAAAISLKEKLDTMEAELKKLKDASSAPSR